MVLKAMMQEDGVSPTSAKRQRKGQFFILSAVVIVVSLFAISATLNQGKIEPGAMQKETYASHDTSLHTGIRRTVHDSAEQNITENLQLYLFYKQDEYRRRGDSFLYAYAIDWPEVVVNATVKSERQTIHINYP